MTWLHAPTATCHCGPADVDHECGTGPDHAGRIAVTGYCIHGKAVTELVDAVI